MAVHAVLAARLHPGLPGPPPDTPLADFGEELARLRATDPALARAEMAKSLACTPGGPESARGRAALADPAAAIHELAEVTERAWHALLAPDWPRLRALLEAEIAYRSRQLADGGLRRLFADLHPRVTWSGDTLTVRTRTDFVQTQDLDGRGVLLLPSIFVWPDVVSGFDPRGSRPSSTPHAESAACGASRRPGRRWPGSWEPTAPRYWPRSTPPRRRPPWAHRLRLAPSSVSAHLSVLRAAGLLTAHRHGHEVRYERSPLGSALLG